MATTTQYLEQLQNDKANLVNNLVAKGVQATDEETFTQLVPKVLDIQGGGSDVEINDCNYLFYANSRLNELNEILSICKNVTTTQYMFYLCTNLTAIDLSNFDTSTIYRMNGMFQYCNNLTTIDLSNFDTSYVLETGYMFRSCTNLATIIINRQDVFKMSNVNMFSDTPIEKGTGYVYVPDNMVDIYKTATNWSTYADQIRPISELPTEA